MNIGIDFDGTCVTHDFPNVGKDIGAVPVLKELVNKGHHLILFTMRSDFRDKVEQSMQTRNYLREAIEWFDENEIPLHGVNKNPGQDMWTDSPKAYCHLYIDDAGLGIPLIYNQHLRPFVDWKGVKDLLIKRDIL